MGLNEKSAKTSGIIALRQTQILKGIAIVLVVCCHLGGQYTRIFTPLGGIGVAIFLILSAYGLEKSFINNGLKKFWIKRVITVFIPYGLCEIIAYMMENGSVFMGGYIIIRFIVT